jgi:predicted amidophosphoribosyltransferase
MNAFDPRGGKCDNCGKHRSLCDGICHECEQAERDAAVIVDEHGEEWTPGGYRL